MLCIQLFTNSINHFSVQKDQHQVFALMFFKITQQFWENYFLEIYLTTHDCKLVLLIMLMVLDIKLVHIILWGDWGIVFEFSVIFHAQGEQLVLWLFPGQLISLCILLCVWPLCFNLLYFFPSLFVLQHVFRAFSKCYVCTCLQDKLVTDGLKGWASLSPQLLYEIAYVVFLNLVVYGDISELLIC